MFKITYDADPTCSAIHFSKLVMNNLRGHMLTFLTKKLMSPLETHFPRDRIRLHADTMHSFLLPLTMQI